MFQKCFKNVSKMFQRCFKDVSKMFQRCFKNVSKMFQRCFKNVSKCFKDASNMFQTCFKDVLKMILPRARFRKFVDFRVQILIQNFQHFVLIVFCASSFQNSRRSHPNRRERTAAIRLKLKQINFCAGRNFVILTIFISFCRRDMNADGFMEMNFPSNHNQICQSIIRIQNN